MVKKSILYIIISTLSIFFLASCGGKNAVDVAGKFWKAVSKGDLEKAKSYSTRETASSLTINNESNYVHVDFELGSSIIENGRTIISTHMVNDMNGTKQTIDMKTILVREDGEWKVDVMSTMLSMFGDEVQEMMQRLTKTMGETIENIGSVVMEGMQKSLEQFSAGSSGQSYSTQEPEKLLKTRNYKIKFGYMKKNIDGTVYVYKKTKRIPLRSGNFRWGYTIEADGDPFTTYSIDYSPDGPMLEGGQSRVNSPGEQGWESNVTTVTGGRFSRAYRNNPGDTGGPRKIKIFIEDKLAKTIEFKLGDR